MKKNVDISGNKYNINFEDWEDNMNEVKKQIKYFRQLEKDEKHFEGQRHKLLEKEREQDISQKLINQNYEEWIHNQKEKIRYKEQQKLEKRAKNISLLEVNMKLKEENKQKEKEENERKYKVT